MVNCKTMCDPKWFDAKIHPQFSSWLDPVENDNQKAYCRVCKKKIVLSNMGIQALKSHASGTKHKNFCKAIVNTVNMDYFLKPAKSSLSEPSCSNAEPKNAIPSVAPIISSLQAKSSTPCVGVTLKEYGFNNMVLKKELIWCLTASHAHLSNRQAKTISRSFSALFEDSKYA